MLNYQRNYIIFRILDSFFRNWLVFAITLVGVSGVVGTALIVRAAKFTASATIRLGTEEVNEVTRTLGYKADVGWSTPAQVKAQAFQDLMRDTMPGGFVDRAIKAAKLKNPINTDPRVKDERFDEFVKNVSVGPISSSVIQVNLVWSDSVECEALVDALQKEFIHQAELDNSAASQGTLAFLDSQVEVFRKKMQDSEKALVAFKQTHSGLLPDALTGQIDAVTNLKMQRDELSIKAQDADLKLTALRARLGQIKPVSVLEQRVGNDPAIGELRELMAQRADRIRRDWKPSSAVVQDIDRKIRALESDIRKREKADPTRSRNVLESTVVDNPEYRDIEQRIVEAEIERKTQNAQMSAIDARIGEYEALIAKLPADERTLTERVRDYKLLQGQFEDLIERRQQATIKRDLGQVTARSQINPLNIITAESTATAKKKAISIATALAVGLVLALGLIVLREWMDPSLRYEMDAMKSLEMPVLASLPESTQLRFPVRGTNRRLPGGSAPAIGGRA
ncbi:MAG: GumC family protein [Armatimonadota bacterium]